MTIDEFREALRLEMRALAAELWNNAPRRNYDAAVAIEKIVSAIEKRFPESLREYCARVEPCLGMVGDLDVVGERLELPRVGAPTYRDEYEADREYRVRLRKRMLEVLA